LDGTTDPLKKIIADADVVVGIWQSRHHRVNWRAKVTIISTGFAAGSVNFDRRLTSDSARYEPGFLPTIVKSSRAPFALDSTSGLRWRDQIQIRRPGIVAAATVRDNANW
jgi:hypothetical protein